MPETPSATGFDWEDGPLYPQDTHAYTDQVADVFGTKNEATQHRALAALVYADTLSNGTVLSQRQAEVWVLNRVGFSQRDVAALLDLDTSTVSDYATTADKKVQDALRFATELNLSLYDEALRAMDADIPDPHGAVEYAGSVPWGKPYSSTSRRNVSRLVSYETESIWYEGISGVSPPTMHIIRAFIDTAPEDGAVVIQRLTYTSDEQGYDKEEAQRVYGSEQELFDAELQSREFTSPLDLFATYDAVSSVAGWNAIPNPLTVYEGDLSLRDAFDAIQQNVLTPESLAGMVAEDQQVLATDVLPAKENAERRDVPDIVLQPSETWSE